MFPKVARLQWSAPKLAKMLRRGMLRVLPEIKDGGRLDVEATSFLYVCGGYGADGEGLTVGRFPVPGEETPRDPLRRRLRERLGAHVNCRRRWTLR